MNDQKKNISCPQCGSTDITPGENGISVCNVCGSKFTFQSAPETDNTLLGGQDQTIMTLVALFLGGLGIHNFMMGETRKGIIKIIFSFCCGLGYILGWIDMVKMLLDKYKVEPKKFF